MLQVIDYPGRIIFTDITLCITINISLSGSRVGWFLVGFFFFSMPSSWPFISLVQAYKESFPHCRIQQCVVATLCKASLPKEAGGGALRDSADGLGILPHLPTA